MHCIQLLLIFSYRTATVLIIFLGLAIGSHAQLKEAESKIPVTQRGFNDDTSKLQFAIISDIWGGRRPGVFEDAIEKIQLLQPQFVISVGDLIDGKTYDTVTIHQQWNEFDQTIRLLTMPFFYVAGNHDISNATMEAEWKKRLGLPYYYFVYKKTLFLCINTQDGGYSGITDQQADYFKKVIAEHADVRWTFIFMHRPVWQGSGNQEEGYEKIEAALKGRNYTLFSGHHHTYLQVRKNGQKHFVLGSTGGGSDLRGAQFGEFDHITLVTLTDEEPKIVNLKLEGIIQEDVVDEQIHSITQTLIGENWLVPIPFVSEYQIEKTIQAEIELVNPTAYPLKVTGQLFHGKNIQFIPTALNLTVAPYSKLLRSVTIKRKDASPIDLALLTSVEIALKGRYTYQGKDYELPARKKLLLSWKMVPAAVNKMGSVGTSFYGRDTSGMIRVNTPEYLEHKWYWSGPADAFLRFKLFRDAQFVYLIALMNDDQWVIGKKGESDQLYLHLEDEKGLSNQIGIDLSNEQITLEGKGNIQTQDLSIHKNFKDNLLFVEIKIPIKKIRQRDHVVRINIGFRDQDQIPEKEFSVLFWKPVWETEGDYKNSGTYLLK